MESLQPISPISDESSSDGAMETFDLDTQLSGRARSTSMTLLILLQTLFTLLSVLGQAFDMCVENLMLLEEDEESEDDDNAAILQLLPTLWSAAGAAKRRRIQHPLVSWYVKPRSSINSWNHYVSYTHADDARFREVFRLPLELFNVVCDLVRTDLQQGRIPVFLRNVPGRIFSVERKVAVAILRLSSGMRCIDVSEHFGCGRSTVSKIVNDFAYSLVRNGRHLLQWPQTESRLTEVKEGFKALHSFPNCCGAIDATHIKLDLPPLESGVDWYNRYGYYSMIVQGIVDADMHFLHVNIGWPGCAHDTRVLRNSTFFTLCHGQRRLIGTPFDFGDLRIREYIVGDGGYPLLPWLITPFQRDELTSDDRRNYNYMQSSTRIVVERAFGRLKRSWLYLGKTIQNLDLSSLPRIINACCILHNILIDHEEEEIEAVEQVDLNDPLVDNPHLYYFDWDDEVFMESQRREGELVRNQLMEYANIMREDNHE